MWRSNSPFKIFAKISARNRTPPRMFWSSSRQHYHLIENGVDYNFPSNWSKASFRILKSMVPVNMCRNNWYIKLQSPVWNFELKNFFFIWFEFKMFKIKFQIDSKPKIPFLMCWNLYFVTSSLLFSSFISIGNSWNEMVWINKFLHIDIGWWNYTFIKWSHWKYKHNRKWIND